MPETGEWLEDGWGVLRWINDSVDATQPWKLMIAEDFAGWAAMTSPTSNGGAGFESQWDGAFLHPVRALATIVNDSDRNMEELRTSVMNYFNGQATQLVVFTESHDEAANQPRLPEVIWPANADSWEAKKRSTLAA